MSEGSLRPIAGIAAVSAVLAVFTALSVAVAAFIFVGLRIMAPQAHRAVYDLSLDHSDAASGVTSLSGRMVVEWRGGPACDGYTSEQRVVTRSTDDSGQTNVSDIRLSAWEAIDGSEFRFDRTEYVDGVLGTQEFGTAKREKGKVVLALEYGDPIDLPAGVLFPNAFNIALTKAQQRGLSSFSHLLFDGAQKSATNVTAFLSRVEMPAGDAGKILVKNASYGVALKDMKVRGIHMSYFDVPTDPSTATAATVPSFEMGFSVFPNGVMSNLQLFYDDAVIDGSLKEIEYFKPGSC